MNKPHGTTKRPVYDPPILKVIGQVSTVTLGPTGGPNTDGIFPHHGSA